MTKRLYCKKCDILNSSESKICSQCGQVQETFKYRSKMVAVVLAVFGGLFGAHKFYLREWKWGIFYLLLFWTLLPWAIAIIEGLIFLFTNQERWDFKYNHGVFIKTKKRAFALLLSIMFLVGLFVLVTMPIYKDKNLRYRVNYAVGMAMSNLQPIVEEFYVHNGRFPEKDSELNVISEITFPAGGGCRIEQGGRIRIWFDTLPELKEGEIWLTPHEKSNDGKTVLWTCDGTGRGKDLINRYLPHRCKVKPKKPEGANLHKATKISDLHS